MNLPTSVGRLSYSRPDSGYKLVLDVDWDLAAFYRNLIPKHLPVQPTRYRPHVTVVRVGRDIPKNLEVWGKYKGERITFEYDPEVKFDSTYYWLNVWCNRLTEIRTELGLSPHSIWTRPPGDYIECFHTTIGNMKHVRK